MRLLEAAWFFGMSLLAVILSLGSAMQWPPPFGSDLGGGVRLVYEVDREAIRGDGSEAVSHELIDWNDLERAVQARIDPGATRAGLVRHLPPWQIEIILAERNDFEIDRIKRRISSTGALEFRVVANPVDHGYIIDLAKQQAGDAVMRQSTYVREGELIVGRWARVGRQSATNDEDFRPLNVVVAGDVIRDAGSGQWIEPPSPRAFFVDGALERYLAEQGIEQIELLMAIDDGFDVTGAHLAKIARAWDETARPCVSFDMTRQGAGRMAGLTGSNLPAGDREFYRRLGIMLDGTVLSAPRIMTVISDRGRITGYFTEQEVSLLVDILQAGALPVPLQALPVSETSVAPLPQAVRNSRMVLSIAVGLLLILWLVTILRHGLIGVGACLANLVQALLLLAALLLLRVTVTQPVLLAAAIMAILATIGNEVICEFVRRNSLEQRAPARAWRGLAVGTALVTVVFGLLLLLSIPTWAIAVSATRNVAMAVVLGSLAALLTSSIALALLIAMTIARRPGHPSDFDDGEPITATLA